MIDKVIGEINKEGVRSLIDEIESIEFDKATLYVGYPLLSSADETVQIDAALTCEDYGLVIFDVIEDVPNSKKEWEIIENRQDELARNLISKLLQYDELTHRRRLAFDVPIATYSPQVFEHHPPDDLNDIHIVNRDEIGKYLSETSPIEKEKLRALDAAFQRVTSLKPKNKRKKVSDEYSKGGIIRHIEKEMANLDRWQNAAAVETPESPQRIRGLAGSGKTVVLALKAAYLHSLHPDWDIGVTFQTRSLYQQFRSLIRRFVFEHSQDEPDWRKLKILHAWGSVGDPGVYSKMCVEHGRDPLSFNQAREKYSRSDAFAGACAEFLDDVPGEDRSPIFDSLLIDEAQDFPTPFFQLAYSATHEPHRIVWAYDEMQNLSEHSMAPPEDLFGRDDSGEPHVQLRNREGQPDQDIILPVCYRNPPWTLATAHALGFGIYRNDGLVQFFDDPKLWSDVGYNIAEGNISPGESVVLERKPNSAPGYFEEKLNPEKSIQFRSFESYDQEALTVAKSIERQINDHELYHSDILVILPDPVTVSERAAPLIEYLEDLDISSHIAGVGSSRDELFIEESIAISNIYRAKGNEAAVVYLLNSEYCHSGPELIKRRNTLFTAISRSRGWVKVSGVGKGMNKLSEEYQSVVDNNYKLKFEVPTKEELDHLRQIHRDMSKDEIRERKKEERFIKEYLSRIKSGDTSIEHLPPEIRSELREALELDNGE